MSPSMERLILFARRPRPGRVKTRLTPPLSPGQALELYRAFLEDQLRFIAGFVPSYAVELCLDRRASDSLSPPPLPPGVESAAQGAGSLGERMLRAFRRSHLQGNAATVIIGADTPTLPESIVGDAFRALREGADAAIAPAEDGGYVLIGLGAPREELFEAIPWGGPDVLAATRKRAARQDIALELLTGWYDVDDGADLSRLRSDLGQKGARERAPATARLLHRLACGGRGVV